MKKYLLFGIGAIAVAFTACTNEDYVSQSSSHDCLLSATVEGNTPSTRVGFDVNGSFYWNTGDQIGVTSINNDLESSALSGLTLIDGAGTGTGKFTGNIVGSVGNYAVYPYSEDDKVASGTLTYNYKSSYTEKLETSKAGEAGATETNASRQSFNPAMAGVISGNNVTFKHLGGVLVVQIPDLPIDAGKLTVTETNGNKINGKFTTKLSAEENPSVTSGTTATDSEKVTEVNFSGATLNQNAIFYVPLPVAPENGYEFRIKLIDSEGKEYVNVVSPVIKLARRDLYLVTISNVVITGTSEAQSVSSASDASTTLESNESVSVKEVTSDNATITVPSISDSSNSSDEPTSRNVIVEKITSGTTLTVKDANTSTDGTGDASNSVKELNLSLPATNDDTVNLDVTMANTSVTVESSVGTGTTIAEATVSTSETTFVIGKGVTINKLTVNKGSVRVNSGGKIGAITNSTGKTLTIYTEDGATIPSSLGDKIVTASAAENDLRKAAAIGGTISLSDDITVSEAIVVAGKVTIDLNGHTIAPSDSYGQAHNPFTGNEMNSKDAVIVVCRGAELTITGASGSITDGGKSNFACVIKLTDSTDSVDDNATLNVKGGVIESHATEGYAISGNGNRHGTVINVTGGKITSESGLAIYQPQVSTTTISGGTLTGYLSAIEVRSGTLNIKGGLIQATSTTYRCTSNTNGHTTSGVAVAIAQHTTGKDINVSVSGSAILYAPYYSIYEADPEENSPTNVTLSVTGGLLYSTYGVYSKDCTKFISNTYIAYYNALKQLLASSYLTTSPTPTIRLYKDITASGIVNVSGKSVILDLNGHTLTRGDASTNFIQVYLGILQVVDSSTKQTGKIVDTVGSNTILVTGYTSSTNSQIIAQFALRSGSIESSNTAIYAMNSSRVYVFGGSITSAKQAIYAQDNKAEDKPCEIKISGGKITTTDTSSAYASVEMWPYAGASSAQTLTVSGASTTIESKGSYAIAGNGATAETSISISGGDIKAASYGIYHPQKGTMTISGGTIEGGKAGIEIRAGKLDITGGTIRTSYTGDPETQANGSGTTTIGAALAVSQHTTKYDLNVSISGDALLEGPRSLYQHNAQGNDDEALAKVTLDVTGGTFKGQVQSDNKTGFISGGTFTVSPDQTYIKSGYSISESNGTYTVSQ